jgi:deazaflavin-dependent oxidoreductase (nitroreductase family)
MTRPLPRGLLVGTTFALSIVWTLYALGGGLLSAWVQSGVYVALLVLTWRSRRLKVLVVRTFQRCTVNPLMRLCLAVGVNPLGVAILETTGRSTGRRRRVPVGNGRDGDDFWIIAEHGLRAGYVRNILANPRVRVRLRLGLRYRWVDGYATVRTEDDPLARQRQIIAWHPLRMLNAVNVRVLGADLLVVHVRLDLAGHDRRDGSSASTSHTKPALHTGDVLCEEQVSHVPMGNL